MPSPDDMAVLTDLDAEAKQQGLARMFGYGRVSTSGMRPPVDEGTEHPPEGQEMVGRSPLINTDPEHDVRELRRRLRGDKMDAAARQVGRGVSNAFLGLPGMVNDAITRRGSVDEGDTGKIADLRRYMFGTRKDTPQGREYATPMLNDPEAAARDAGDAPVVGPVAEIAASLNPMTASGRLARLGGEAMANVPRLVQSAKRPVARAVETLARGMATGAGVGAAYEGTKAAGAGLPVGEAAMSGATGGAVGGAVATGLAGAGAKVSNAIRDPRTVTGQLSKNVAAVGGRPGLPLVQRPAVGGMYDEPGYQALEHGDPGTMKMAEQVFDRAQHNIGKKMDAVKVGLDSGEEAARAALRGVGGGQASVFTGPAISEIDDMIGQLTQNRVNPSPDVVKTLQTYRSALIKKSARSYPGGPQGTPEISFDELRDLIKQVNEAAKFGQDPTFKTSFGKRLAGTIANLQRGIAPEMDAALGSYKAEASAAKRQNDALMGKRATAPEETAARRSNAVSRIADVGKRTKSGINRGNRMEEANVSPADMRRMRGRNAAEALRLGAGSPGRIGATKESFVARNIPPLLVRGVEPAARELSRANPAAAGLGGGIMEHLRAMAEKARSLKPGQSVEWTPEELQILDDIKNQDEESQ